MDERVRLILDQIPAETLARVASGVLRRDVADAGHPTYTEITTPHAEDRTIAIVRVAGHSSAGPWSSVTKLLDLSVPAVARFVGMTQPETEELVYEHGYLAGHTGLRAAHCYAIARPSDTLKLLFLEDLTSAGAPPFSLEQLHEMAVHFGAWNGEAQRIVPDLGFPLLRNGFARRFRSWDLDSKIRQMAEFRDHPLVRALYRDHPLSVLDEFTDAMARLVAWGESQPGALAYGDSSAGNLFHRPGETIGVDWASLTLDPLGVDAGCLVGSSITWGHDFVRVAEHERDLFEGYMRGLTASGWRGDASDVRRGYFCLFGFYVGATLALPLNIIGADKFLSRSYLEKRYGMVLEYIPAAAAGIVELAPEFTREINALLPG